jgi:hypothetical protein
MREFTDKEIQEILEEILNRFEKVENRFFAGCLGISVLFSIAAVALANMAATGLWGKIGSGLGGFIGVSLIYVLVGYGFKYQGLASAERSFNLRFPKRSSVRQRAVDFLGTVTGSCKGVAKELYDEVSKTNVAWGSLETAETQLSAGLSEAEGAAHAEALNGPPFKKSREAPASPGAKKKDKPMLQGSFDYIPLEPEPGHPSNSKEEDKG